MAWGVKTIHFDSGDSVKMGNTILECSYAAIIQDYLEFVEKYNSEAEADEKVGVYSAITYYRMLKVIFLKILYLIFCCSRITGHQVDQVKEPGRA